VFYKASKAKSSMLLALLSSILLLGCYNHSSKNLQETSKKSPQSSPTQQSLKEIKKPSVTYTNPKIRTPYRDIFYNYNKKLTSTIRNARIIIDKEARRLFLYSGSDLVKIYPISLGLDPVGDKERQGDRRTPEGKFYVCNKNPKSKYYLSLGISYPNIEDAERGLKQGLITQQQYRAIIQAIKAGRKPPWNTALGGAICIHGGGIPWDWTYGCIAMRNSDIEELFRVTPMGTPVVIKGQSTMRASLEEETPVSK